MDGWNTRIAAIREGGMAPIADGVVSRWFTEDFAKRAPAQVEAARQMLLHSPPEGYVATCAAMRDEDLREAISRVQPAHAGNFRHARRSYALRRMADSLRKKSPARNIWN